MSEDVTVEIKVLRERFLIDGIEVLCSINGSMFYLLVGQYGEDD